MTVKASVSISEEQETFARGLVREGRYASLSAVVQRGLELLRGDRDEGSRDRRAARAPARAGRRRVRLRG